jgi:hypothetical protein
MSAMLANVMPHLNVGAQKWTAISADFAEQELHIERGVIKHPVH